MCICVSWPPMRKEMRLAKEGHRPPAAKGREPFSPEEIQP